MATARDLHGPLRFSVGLFPRIWGGDRLKSLPGVGRLPDGPVGEAWLISDHDACQSVCTEGLGSGATLHALIERDARSLLGNSVKPTIHGRFPLLLKLLDAREVLSVQVHPDDDCARRLNEPDVGKTEMWYVLDAEKDSYLICGMKSIADAEQFRQTIANKRIEHELNRVPVVAGDAYFVPAGAVHAIGGGILLAEIQQNSDLTYRIFDWNRLEGTGQPRELHIDKACEAIHFDHAAPEKTVAKELADGDAQRAVLASCPYFVAERVTVSGSYEWMLRSETFAIVLPISGSFSITAAGVTRSALPYEALLIPGWHYSFDICGQGSLLVYYASAMQ